MELIGAKSIVVTKKNTSWFGTDYNMNIYRGCSHGCIYCDSRSSCYGIEDFDNIKVKENALEIIRNDLRRKVKKGVIAMGAMSDPYNPLEEKYKFTRNALELINAFGFGVTAATKSNLITRDIDIFKDIAEHSPVLLKITVTTHDDKLSKIIEPNAPVSSERFEALYKLRSAGLFAGILLMPVLPFIEDSKENIFEIIKKAYKAKVNFIYPAFGVTLRENQRVYFFEQLDKHFVGIKEKYISQYRNKYMCVSKKAKELYNFFKEECDKRGILYNMKDIIRAYKLGYEYKQLDLFDF